MGVSNTANTLNFINSMKDFSIGIFIGLGIALVISVVIFCSYIGNIKAITSSPVEEMYHKQLVVTIDSILDARFGTDYCKEDIDTVNTNTFSTRFSGIFRLRTDIKSSICLFPLSVLV